jgi:hypothetical protein
MWRKKPTPECGLVQQLAVPQAVCNLPWEDVLLDHLLRHVAFHLLVTDYQTANSNLARPQHLISSTLFTSWQNFLFFKKRITGNLISLSDLLLPACVVLPEEQLHPGQSEPVLLPSEHPGNAACTLPSDLLFHWKLDLLVWSASSCWWAAPSWTEWKCPPAYWTPWQCCFTNSVTSKNIIIVFVLTCPKQPSLGLSQMFGLARKLLSRMCFHFPITSPKSFLVVAKCKLISLHSTEHIIDQFNHY